MSAHAPWLPSGTNNDVAWPAGFLNSRNKTSHHNTARSITVNTHRQDPRTSRFSTNVLRLKLCTLIILITVRVQLQSISKICIAVACYWGVMVCFLPSQTALCHSASKRGWLRGVLCSVLEEKWLFLPPLHIGEVEMNRALVVGVLTLQE